jgi:putative hydrolase of the HAD superfamily
MERNEHAKKLNNMKISCLFLDIGGVLLSNGWGHEFRQLAIEHFNIDGMEESHRLIYITYEEGRISLDEYLDRTVFYKSRDFTRTELLNFIYSLSTADTDMIDFIRKIKLQYGLKIIAVSNESREINEYRINTFKLNEIFDFYVSSCYVNVRKPDPKIFQIALDGAQVPANEIVYIDDKQMFIDIAKDLGINGICHTDYLSTAKALAEFGFTINH